MTAFGYFLSCEEFTPAQLIDQARAAEQAGFTLLAISDHYHPWNDAQGSSPFVWGVIGALSQVTRLPVTTLVTCPTVRLHPAVVAQAAATADVQLVGGLRLGVGTGEALNEHVLGDRWPPFDVRAEMLEEAVTVMRELFTGRQVSYSGSHYTVENARLYTPPKDGRIPVYVSAFGPKAADLAARYADGLVTLAPDTDLIGRYRAAGGTGPVVGGVKVCWARERERAVKTVHELWPNDLLPGELAQVLPTTRHFEQAAELVTEDMVAHSVTCGDDPQEHADRLRSYVGAGFDEVYVGQIGREQGGFFDFYREQILPQVT
ncbi:TIGR03557 family F420-dependent LLM class oxidoreductase [Streptomyces sp. FH025]|uniref:TIGR03557 family F420-dependent LLM class oxidoreductase n=1 Tax=Streptomyces sp. FH025 TaxID=2815937 RepID=UPI001A9E987F|nr:TIGR03557 family F420-dependent LLM class oxidoreductase [Streptomyces sp. FH025]MBO1413449.1 TIGR03557 family F420-dependent LLM class oxidoreductase [Streptomyces sp. FH025]